jgi:3-hydroxyisobutyrate dehydrogenase-like beta-hydroxyacid dehydrogenase
VQRTGTDLLYVDCNAIAPETARAVGRIVESAGARFVDAGIIGPPPRPGATGTRFYAAGAAAADFARLRDHGLDVRVIGERPGDASAVKMCYAALTKGTTAIMTQLLIAAERLGVSGPLRAELEESQPEMLQRMRRSVPAMVPKAHRWVGEMEEIARTFTAAGLTPLTFEGAAALYAFVADTPLGRVSPEEWAGADRDCEELARELARTRRVD